MEHEIFEHAVVIEQCIIHVERKNYLFSKHTLDFLPVDPLLSYALRALAVRGFCLRPLFIGTVGCFFSSARELVAQGPPAPVYLSYASAICIDSLKMSCAIAERPGIQW